MTFNLEQSNQTESKVTKMPQTNKKNHIIPVFNDTVDDY